MSVQHVNQLQVQTEPSQLPPMRLFRVTGVYANDGTIGEAFVEGHGFLVSESGVVSFMEIVNDTVDGGYVVNTKLRRAFRLWSEVEEIRAYSGQGSTQVN